MKQKVVKLLQDIVIQLDKDVSIELTPAKGHGDFATNVAMKLAKPLGRNPRDIADQIIKDIKADFIEKAEVAGPGFINIFLKGNVHADTVNTILDKGADFGKGSQGKYINVEYVSANPTGHLHLGHARGAALGSALVDILKFAGNKVDSEYYINDAGNQIDVLGESTFARYLELFGKPLRLPEDSYRGEDIVEVARFMKEQFGDKFVESKYSEVADTFKEEAKKYLLGVIKMHLKRYNTVIDIYSSETLLYTNDEIMPAIKKLDDELYEKDGATWLNTTKKGDDKDRVLIKKDGKYTYFAPDIAYHNKKLARGYDELINIWGADHIGYIKRMEVALEYLGLPKEKLDILTVQLVKLFKNGEELKMSKRKGTTFTVEELIDEVGTDTARWFLLDRSPNSEILFDINKALEKTNDNPVFFVKYTHARSCQLIKKSDVDPSASEFNDKEVELINILSKFPEVIENVANTHKVNLLTQYLVEVSRGFNSWYSNTKAIGDKRESSMIALAKAVKIVLCNGLTLLGISSPDQV